MKKVLPAWITCLLIFTVSAHANGTGYTNVADTGTYYYHARHSLKSGIVRAVVKIMGIKNAPAGPVKTTRISCAASRIPRQWLSLPKASR